MAYRRAPRRRFSRTYRSSKGRQGLWVNALGYDPQTFVDTPSTVAGAALVTPVDWERQLSDNTRPKERGGARLEALIASFGGAILTQTPKLVTMSVELIILSQPILVGVDPVSFGGYLNRTEDQHILHYNFMQLPKENQTVAQGATTSQFVYPWNFRVRIRPKTRLTDTNIVAYVMFTAATDTSDDIDSYVHSWAHRAYVSTP